MSWLPRVLAVVVLLAAVACGQDQPAGSAPPDPTGPLEALAPCTDLPDSTAESVDGLIVPERTIIQQVTPSDPLVNVGAYAPLTPVQFEQHYRNLDGIEILVGENEIYEAELLVSDGKYRNFLKATAVCDRGVQIIAVVAPEVHAEGLPLPQGATPPPAT